MEDTASSQRKAKHSAWVSGPLRHWEAPLFQALDPRSCLLANGHWIPACLLPMRPPEVPLGNQEGPLLPITRGPECQRHSNVQPSPTAVSLRPHVCLWTFIPEATAWLPRPLRREDSRISHSRKTRGQIQLKRPLDDPRTLEGGGLGFAGLRKASDHLMGRCVFLDFLRATCLSTPCG